MPPKRSRASVAHSSDPGVEPSSKKVKTDSTSTVWTKDSISKLNYDELRQALKDFGENPGPISDSTKPMYERLLLKRQQEDLAGQKAELATTTSAASFSSSLSPPAQVRRSPAAGQHSTLSPSSRTPAREAATQSGGLGSPWSRPAASPASSSSSSSFSSASSSFVSAPKQRTSTVSGGAYARKAAKPAITAQDTRGLVAATYTPLTTSGDIHLPVIDQYADFLVDGGVSGVFVNGSTGEGVKFSVDERKDLLEKWIGAASGRLSVFAHVGAESIKDAQEMAIHAAEVGAHAIAVIAPTMFKPRTAEHMVDYCAAVALAAPNVPLYYYHITGLTGCQFSIEDFLDLAVRIPSFAGVKYSDADLALFGACRYHSDQTLHMMYGKDEQMLAALVMGAETFVGSTYTLYPKLYHAIAKAFHAGHLEEARELQLFSWKVVKLLLRFGGIIPAGRCLLEHVGVPVGPPRVPDRAPDAANAKLMIQELKSIGFAKWM